MSTPVSAIILTDNIRRGIGLMVLGALLVPGLDAAAKLLGGRHGLPTGEIALLRFVLQCLMVLPFLVVLEGWRSLRIRHVRLNLLRGALLGVASFLFFLALKSMPLADATAIFFVEPMIVTLLSALFLKESVGWRRIAAVLVGFVGALIVIRPNFLALGLVATLPLMTAALVAVYLILSRHLAARTPPLAMHFYAGIGGSLVMLAACLGGMAIGMPEMDLVVPRGTAVWGLLVIMGLFATVGHLLFVQAYRYAPASLLAPFSYFEIVSATILGLALFGDMPDLGKASGIAIIVASGVYIVWRENSLARRPPVRPLDRT
ncbi:DMT family transporter [Aureimonas glaciei]|uniref:Permease n=1 Tax=Aureimonas glaciei TaxID=1776957 RepID=A0A916YBN0_9HYPH|nr:DMT family transporter [Aureimonas glaciei]GGD39051.1 permease [Aureimonas glaciei]